VFKYDFVWIFYVYWVNLGGSLHAEVNSTDCFGIERNWSNYYITDYATYIRVGSFFSTVY